MVMSIIGISASQGQGKSTTIKAAMEKSDSIKHLDVQTARETLSEWNYTLAEVNAYMPLKINFQEELLKRHIAALNQPIEPDCTYLVERTFADIFTYALVSVGPFNDHSDWLNDYAKRCAEAQTHCFNRIVFLSGRNYTPEDDGVRSVNPYFSNLTNYCILYYTRLFAAKDPESVVRIDTPDLDERVEQLLQISGG